VTANDYNNELERRERELRRREIELRLRELDSEINNKDIKFYQTTKHQPEKIRNWQQKVIVGLKLFSLGVVAIVAVRIASALAGIVIVSLLAFVAYKLFLDDKKL
jgi:hypothetical protein